MTRLVGSVTLPGGARLLQVEAADATEIRPSQWFRLTLNDQPFSLATMDYSTGEGWLAFVLPGELAIAVGPTAYGTPCSLEGPFGEGIFPVAHGRRRILLADDVGLPATLLAARDPGLELHLCVLGLTGTPAIRMGPSRFVVHAAPPGVIAGATSLEEAGIASRIAHPDGLPGCHPGTCMDLLLAYLAGQTAEWRWETTVTVLGTEATVAACREGLRAQVGAIDAHTLPPIIG